MAVAGTLGALARHAETRGHVYPYKQEDWLRYLLPTLWPSQGEPLMLLSGPSTVRENLLVEEFGRRFQQYRVIQGALSVGTLSDVMLSLAYIEKLYGAAALPGVMVLGISPRFLAELPAERPFASGIARYSGYYSAPAPDAGFRLTAKSTIRGVMDESRFLLFKQRPRYRAGIAWLTAKLVGPHASAWLSRTPLARPSVARFFGLARVMELGVHDYALEEVSPYKYRDTYQRAADHLGRLMDDPGSWWLDVHRWDPAAAVAEVGRRVSALREYATRHAMVIYVVNMPEHSLSLQRYDPGFADRYRSLLRSVFDGMPVLDLRCFLTDDEFLDVEHALPPGARRTTEEVIRFLKDIDPARAARLDGRRSAGLSSDWKANSCTDSP